MTISALDEPVRSLLERIAAPAALDIPALDAIGAALLELASDVDYLGRWIERLGADGGGLPIHAPERGPRLTLVHRSEGRMSAVHDHGTWVAITPVAGTETHRRWRVVDPDGPEPRIEVADDRSLRPATVATLLPPDDLHDHGHLVGRGRPAHILILLGDDQTRFTRNEWDAASGRHRILRSGDPGRWLATEPMPIGVLAVAHGNPLGEERERRLEDLADQAVAALDASAESGESPPG